MKAIVQYKYGPPFDSLELREIGKPEVKDDEVLVRVHAASLAAGDYFILRGSPWVGTRPMTGLLKPRKNYIPGHDLSGRVEAVGRKVKRFQPDDALFGANSGTCAEYVCAVEDKFAPKPANLTFEQAAAIPTSARAALWGLRDSGKVQPGQRVLINGASGGVGTFAVQIAKAFGAEVTGVCSTKNLSMVHSIGADHVIDYTREDFTRGGQRYDLILDMVASHSLSDYRRVLTPGGRHLPNTGHGGMGFIFKAFVSSLFVRQQERPVVGKPKNEDLTYLTELIESGKVTPVIDRTYPLADVPEAFRYLEEEHASGKVVITVSDDR